MATINKTSTDIFEIVEEEHTSLFGQHGLNELPTSIDTSHSNLVGKRKRLANALNTIANLSVEEKVSVYHGLKQMLSMPNPEGLNFANEKDEFYLSNFTISSRDAKNSLEELNKIDSIKPDNNDFLIFDD